MEELKKIQQTAGKNPSKEQPQVINQVDCTNIFITFLSPCTI